MQTQTLRETAQAYTPQPKVGNIAELEEVNLDDIEVYEEEVTYNKDGKDKKTIEHRFRFNEQVYRVPRPVLEDIKKFVKLKPTLTKVRVLKTGTDLKTKYEVVPLD